MPERNLTNADPQDFIPKLKKHLLPRIRSLIRPELPALSDDATNVNWTSVVLNSGRIYQHKIMRLNFTTYDVRRDEDMIHPGTSHSNIMVLNSEPGAHPFLYARVLGIFHANVVYLGEDTRDFCPRRLDFLWVRWYTLQNVSAPLATGLLDCIQFPPMADGDSFGFLDPADVVRACHAIPLFSQGQVHPDRIGISFWAGDVDDWKFYCLDR